MTRPAASQDAGWEDQAVDIVVAASSGYPYFLQEFAKASWDFAVGPTIEPDDARLGIQAGRDKLDSGFYASRWNRATPGERVQQVGPTRANLIHKGLVYAPEHGLIAYTVPGMAAFVSRQAE